MFGQRGRTPDDTAPIRPTDPWAHTAPLDPDPDLNHPAPYLNRPYQNDTYPHRPSRDAETYDEDLDDGPPPARRRHPLALAGTFCAIVISLGLVVVLLSPVFSDKPAPSTAPNLPGLLEQPPAATLAPQPAPEVPVPTDSPEPTASPQPVPSEAATGNAAVEDAVVAFVNAVRRQVRCDPVQHDSRLRQAARRHSTDMAAGSFLSHTGSDGSSAEDRMTAAGYDTPLSENLARGFRSAREVVQGWLGSREQRQNILDCDARAIGVGVAVGADGRPYWTQDFGR
ncbi:hypothetical protein HC028_06400 [Planosporangium flavigriseum]|uniref:SCP domain-containing protein n=1 Tax=Planosporangium flavigriseum TaxID=373681 RepID=A0A8J3LSX9_9ACTN|nr:CAP domain-containing protein [Planosporangium flavigriseum]NJC64144.1 hypothetical protein [Planosporangium flavigriseum]GIG73026.1 hypothetical protein Pfl04_14300 [Planosporangium flavigriseum]